MRKNTLGQIVQKEQEDHVVNSFHAEVLLSYHGLGNLTSIVCCTQLTLNKSKHTSLASYLEVSANDYSRKRKTNKKHNTCCYISSYCSINYSTLVLN